MFPFIVNKDKTRDLHRQAAVSDSPRPPNTTNEIVPPPVVYHLNAAYKQLLLQQGSDRRAAPINLRLSLTASQPGRITKNNQRGSAALVSAHSGLPAQASHPPHLFTSPLK